MIASTLAWIFMAGSVCQMAPYGLNCHFENSPAMEQTAESSLWGSMLWNTGEWE